MFDVASPEQLLRYTILALPALGLLVLLFLLQSRYQQRHDAQEQESTSSPAIPPRDQYGIVSTQALAPGATTGASSGLQVYAGETVAELEERLAVAERGGEPLLVATTYLALGRAHMANGEETEGLNALRSAAGLAALHKAAELHAECRLDLAEAAYAAGDPTSACEHWQMARMAFLDADMRSEGDKIDRRMRANGCPTDWILTDF